jgi:hypothetical protein
MALMSGTGSGTGSGAAASLGPSAASSAAPEACPAAADFRASWQAVLGNFQQRTSNASDQPSTVANDPAQTMGENAVAHLHGDIAAKLVGARLDVPQDTHPPHSKSRAETDRPGGASRVRKSQPAQKTSAGMKGTGLSIDTNESAAVMGQPATAQPMSASNAIVDTIALPPHASTSIELNTTGSTSAVPGSPDQARFGESTPECASAGTLQKTGTSPALPSQGEPPSASLPPQQRNLPAASEKRNQVPQPGKALPIRPESAQQQRTPPVAIDAAVAGERDKSTSSTNPGMPPVTVAASARSMQQVASQPTHLLPESPFAASGSANSAAPPEQRDDPGQPNSGAALTDPPSNPPVIGPSRARPRTMLDPQAQRPAVIEGTDALTAPAVRAQNGPAVPVNDKHRIIATAAASEKNSSSLIHSAEPPAEKTAITPTHHSVAVPSPATLHLQTSGNAALAGPGVAISPHIPGTQDRPHTDASTPASPSPASDTFAALDAEGARPATTWVHAGARHAEAGYLDPSLGWVGVRAATSGDTLHAAIIPGSTEAAQALGGHLAALNRFLADHHAQPAYVTMAPPDHGQPGNGFNGVDQGTAEQHPDQNERRHSSPDAESIHQTSRSEQVSNWAAPISVARGGAHISVMA